MEPPASTERSTPLVKALEHAIDVLDALGERGEMGVSELSRHTGLSKAAVFKILATFEARRIVGQDPATSRYHLGWRTYELGAQLLSHHRVGPIAAPFVRELCERTGETVLFGILDEQAVTYIERHESSRAIRMVAAPGRRSALHATASGKVLLAHQPDEVIERVLGGGLRRYTPATLTDPDALRQGLRRVLADGYAFAEMEHEPEISSVSAPVRDYTGGVVAALTLAAPSSRFSAAAMREALPVLLEVAGEIGERLGAGAPQALGGAA
jgi:DNA-binding IclR family transcriptional regulator